ncbi:type IV pilus assembly protein FimV [Desulfomicrobium salsuginis]
MRRAVLLIIGLCFLTSITRPAFSEKPLRLFFEKNISVEAEPGQEHTVRQGEWLFKILQDKGYSGTQIQQLMPGIQALNPNIPNLNRLKPGQIIRLPEGVAAAPPAPARPSPNISPDTYEKRAYVVQAGDTLVEILQHQGVPASLIFGKYMDLFLELNPSIPDTNTLRAGQEIILPVVKGGTAPATAPAETTPPQKPAQVEKAPDPTPAPAKPVTIVAVPVSPDTRVEAVANQTGTSMQGLSGAPSPAAAGPAVSQAGPAPEPAPSPLPESRPQEPAQPEVANAAPSASNATGPADTRTPQTGLPFIKTVLKEMRFTFMPGDESMFPLPGSGWLHVKLFETPLVEAPWGDKILFCPVPKSADWIANANKLGMKVCTVSPRWSLQEVLEKVAQASPRAFRLWSADRDLVLTRSGVGLTLQSPQMAIVDMGGRKTVNMVWARQTPGESPLPQGLHEVLDEAQVNVIELDAFNELSRLPARPRDSIYVPVATHMDLIRAINPANPEAYFGQGLPADLSALLQLLRSKDDLHQGMASASWASGPGTRIGIQVPAWNVSGGASRIILLDRRFADPYLVSVLSREGYTCFVLPD